MSEYTPGIGVVLFGKIFQWRSISSPCTELACRHRRGNSCAGRGWEVRERPILFSAPMVRALLAGSKTQTRRLMKEQPASAPAVARMYLDRAFTKPAVAAMWDTRGLDGSTCCICPYGVPGDHLWVRETWQAWCDFDAVPPRDIPPGSAVQYLATYDGWVSKKRPGMFMPRWASRITLEIAGVRVERLRDISEADANAEGCRCNKNTTAETGFASYRDAFRDLWESINGSGSWEANPWVWCVEFKVLTTPPHSERSAT